MRLRTRRSRAVVSHESATEEESTDDLAESIFHYLTKTARVTSLPRSSTRLRGLGEEIDLEDAQEIVKSADHDGNGSIDLQEFTKLRRGTQWQ